MSQHEVRDVLSRLDQGRLPRKVHDAVKAVVDEITNRVGEKAKGAVSITLDIKREQDDLISIIPTIKTTLPKKPVAGAVMFFGDGGTLHDRDPYQTDVEDVIDIQSKKEG
jgi:hypothetical protein